MDLLSWYYLSLKGRIMQNHTIEKPRTANVTVKLEESDRARIKSLAAVKKRTPHYLMREAIQKYLEAEESEQRFITAAETSLKEYKLNGLHITLEEFSAWATKLKTNPDAPMPICHR
ncbi:MAG: ribbon-helix-helix protein, CopG family [Gallionella sp.]|nr:ribbon-helix-helix protein, CopG family [Gallionella sp.]